MQLLRISREEIDAIKRRVRLESLAADWGVELETRGRHLFALCPFHDERTPSFVITPQKGLFHCFGCGAGGDVIGFVVRFQRMTFPEALRLLAARACVALHDPRAASPGVDREHDELRRQAAARGEDLSGRTS